jgi:PAS domain S-box-containing protein
MGANMQFVVLCDASGRVVCVDKLPRELAAHLVGRTVFELAQPESAPAIERCLHEVRTTLSASGYEAIGNIPGIGARPARARVSPILRGREILGLVVLVADVTERREREQAIQDREEKLQIALAATRMGLWSFDMRHMVTSWDKRVQELYGRSEPFHTLEEWREVLHPEDADRVLAGWARALQTGRYEPSEYRVLRTDGQVRWLASFAQVVMGSDNRPVNLTGALVDVTERRTMEEQLRTSQKMDAVGQLTAGVAHNFNNMLASMLPVLEVVEGKIDEPWRSRVSHARHAGQRAADMVQQLMTFASSGANSGNVRKPRSAELVGTLVDRAVGICREAIDPTIRIVTTSSVRNDDAVRVHVDAGEVEQVLVNIMLNARDALAGQRSAEQVPMISVTLDEIASLDAELRYRALSQGQDVHGDRVVRIRLMDNGSGMPKEVRERIFEPFYTTKEVGKGTGLGLATAYAIVRDHGGLIWCESIHGLGTTFDVYLPVWSERPSDAQGSLQRVRGKVLVVDDDTTVRTVVAEVLREHGYDVFAADGGEAALREAARERPEVVVVDYTMPGMTGVQVAEALRVLDPTIRIVIFTGRVTSDVSALAPEAVLAKPASAEAIVATVERARTARR